MIDESVTIAKRKKERKKAIDPPVNVYSEWPQVRDALAQCELSTRKAARFVERGIKSAVAHSKHNNKMNSDPDRLIVHEALVGRGKRTKKLVYRGRGKVDTQTRDYSHLTVRYAITAFCFLLLPFIYMYVKVDDFFPQFTMWFLASAD